MPIETHSVILRQSAGVPRSEELVRAVTPSAASFPHGLSDFCIRQLRADRSHGVRVATSVLPARLLRSRVCLLAVAVGVRSERFRCPLGTEFDSSAGVMLISAADELVEKVERRTIACATADPYSWLAAGCLVTGRTKPLFPGIDDAPAPPACVGAIAETWRGGSSKHHSGGGTPSRIFAEKFGAVSARNALSRIFESSRSLSKDICVLVAPSS